MNADPKEHVTVKLAEGYERQLEYFGIPAIRMTLQRIDGHYAKCKSVDLEEAQQGQDTAQCPDRGAFEQKVTQLVNETDAILSAIWSTFSTAIESKSQVISNLVAKSDKWSKLGVKLDGMQTTIEKHLKADDWESKGARMFKAALPTQQKALHEFEELTYRTTTVLTSSAAVNAGIFEAVYQSMRTIEEAIEGAAAKEKVDLQYWSDSGSSDDSNGCVSFNYYQRTTTAKANFANLQTWLDSFLTSRGDWSGSAQQVASDMPTVQASVQNLKSGGIWPDPKAQSTAAANVDDQTGSSGRTDSRADGSDGGGGIDLSNHGGIFG